MEGHSLEFYDFLNPGSSLPLAAILLAVFALIFIKRPMIAVAFVCIQPYFLWAVSTNFIASFYLSYLALPIIVIRYKNRIFSKKKAYYGPVLYLATILISWSILTPWLYPVRDGMFCGYSLSRINFVGSLFPIFLLPRILRTEKHVFTFIKTFIQLLIIFNTVLFLSFIVLIFEGRSFELLASTRILGVMPHQWGAPLLLICLVYLKIKNAIPNGPLAAIAIITIICLILTDSRTKVIASLLCSAYLSIPYLRKITIPITFVITLIIFMGVTSPEFIVEGSKKLITARVEQTMSSDLDEATSGRSTLYRQVYEAFLSSPLIGVGEGYATKPGLFRGNIVRQAPHSYYLGVLGQQGLIGAILLGTILFLTIRLMINTHKACSRSPKKLLEVRFMSGIIFYGLMCMLFKASWGTTFWSIALLQSYANVIMSTRQKSPKKNMRTNLQPPERPSTNKKIPGFYTNEG